MEDLSPSFSCVGSLLSQVSIDVSLDKAGTTDVCQLASVINRTLLREALLRITSIIHLHIFKTVLY